jgi:predicted cobalt transporter CbtA
MGFVLGTLSSIAANLIFWAVLGTGAGWLANSAIRTSSSTWNGR